MEEWRLSNNSAEDALSGLSILYKSCESQKDWTEFRDVIGNLHPKHISGYNSNSIWTHVNSENIRRVFGNLNYYERDLDSSIASNIYKLVTTVICNEMSAIKSSFVKPKRPKEKKNTEFSDSEEDHL